MILSDIIEAKRKSIEESKSRISLDEIKAKLSEKKIARRDFKQAISQAHDINIIAEIKKASPTRGIIREDFDPKKIAEIYQLNGASCISVLTEEKYFLGKSEYIKEVKNSCSLPILRKDFIIDEYQVYESALAEADAILLIADILTKKELSHLGALARSLGMAVLPEVHSEEDLEKVLSARFQVIGINNRDLQTFKLNIHTTESLIELIPEGHIIVSESGIRSREDLLFLKSLGINAVLIGEAIMEAQDIGAKLRELKGR